MRIPNPRSLPGDDEVLTFSDWCKLNKISKRTGQRILRSGQGPRVTELSQRRIGITRGNNRRWQSHENARDFACSQTQKESRIGAAALPFQFERAIKHRPCYN